MGDQSISIHKTILWSIIWQIKDQIIGILNKLYVANPDVSIFREIQKQNKSLQQLRLLLNNKISKAQREDLGGKIVNKEPEPDSHSDICEFNLCPYIPKEILEFEVNELDFEELDLENNHEHSLNPGIDQEKDLNECSSVYSFDLSIFEEDESDLQPNDKKYLIEHPKDPNNSENEVSYIHEQLENQCDNNSQLFAACFNLFDEKADYHLGNGDNEIVKLNNSSNDEGLSDNNQDINECLEPSYSCMVNKSSELFNISFENLVNDELLYDFKIIDFNEPCKGDY